jgi:TonB family protein
LVPVLCFGLAKAAPVRYVRDMRKILISLSSFALCGIAAAAGPAPAAAAEAVDPGYDVTVTLTEDGRTIGSPRVTMEAGGRTMLRVPGGYLLDMKLQRVPVPPGDGERLMVDLALSLDRDGKWEPAASPTVVVDVGRTVRMEIEGIGIAVAVYRARSAPAAAAQNAPQAKAAIQSLVSEADYPATALRAGEQGISRVRLDVGPNGRVTGCAVTASSGSAALDSATCRLLVARARFTPARRPDGTSVAGTATAELGWTLPAIVGAPHGNVPGGMATNAMPAPPIVYPRIGPVLATTAPAPPRAAIVEGPRARATPQSLIGFADYPASALRAGEQGTTRVELVVAANGRVSQCVVIGSSGSSALDAATCRLIIARARFIPARDSNGNVAPGHFSTAIGWSLAETGDPTP